MRIKHDCSEYSPKCLIFIYVRRDLVELVQLRPAAVSESSKLHRTVSIDN